MRRNIVEAALATGSFKSLLAGLKETGLVRTLGARGPYTVFAPTDKAFGRLLVNQSNDILSDRRILRSILSYHVVSGEVPSYDMAILKSLGTLQGQRLSVDTKEGLRVNGARVLKADVRCCNGIMHVIDSVLLPERIGLELPA